MNNRYFLFGFIQHLSNTSRLRRAGYLFEVLSAGSNTPWKGAGFILLLLIGGYFFWNYAPIRNTYLNTYFEFSQTAQREPTRMENQEDPILQTDVVLLSLVSSKGDIRVLLEKNPDKEMPLASITKLMTAIIVEENMDQAQIVEIKKGLEWKGSSHRFTGDEKYFVSELEKALLIESNNDVARALSRTYGEEEFFRLMNDAGSTMGLSNTHFFDSTGLDNGESSNFATARDVGTLMKEILLNHSSVVQIISLPSSEICDVEEGNCYLATSTNVLLNDSAFPMKIIGGKTGETALAKKNLVLVTHSPQEGWYLISVVLGSDDNFSDTKKLFLWALDSIEW